MIDDLEEHTSVPFPKREALTYNRQGTVLEISRPEHFNSERRGNRGHQTVELLSSYGVVEEGFIWSRHTCKP